MSRALLVVRMTQCIGPAFALLVGNHGVSGPDIKQAFGAGAQAEVDIRVPQGECLFVQPTHADEQIPAHHQARAADSTDVAVDT
ncbi:hypothetical protein D3C76_1606750 [compost metagenome]